MLPLHRNFERNNADSNLKGRLIIHDIQVEEPFSMKTKNDFIESPPFGLYDTFNHLIYHASDHDKQGLAAYKFYIHLLFIRKLMILVNVNAQGKYYFLVLTHFGHKRVI